MISTGPAIALVLGILAGMTLLLKLVERLFHPHPELLRKLLHVGMGLVVLTFPWLFDRAWPVLLLTGVAAVALGAVKLLPALRDGIGTVVTAVHRPSLGEVCFPIAVGLLFLLSGGDKMLFVVPMLIMTLADAVAALIGITYGKVRYVTSDGLKSAEGSIAFFAIAFLSVHIPLLLFTNVGRTETLLIAVILGVLSMLLEAIAWRGLDNLLIPLGAFGFLNLYLDATPRALLLRLGASFVLLVFALAWRRRSSLDDSALMAAAMFGYGAWMLGGTEWLVAPAVLFLVHVLLWPSADHCRRTNVWVVFCAIAAGLLWLGFHAAYNDDRYLYPYAIAFGTHLAVIGASHSCGLSVARRSRRLAGWIIAGAALVIVQMLPLMLTQDDIMRDALILTLVALLCIAAGGAVFYRLTRVLYDQGRSSMAIHATGLVIGLITSLVAAIVQAQIGA